MASRYHPVSAKFSCTSLRVGDNDAACRVTINYPHKWNLETTSIRLHHYANSLNQS
ncbi:hypothetical protein [Lactobacillus rizhaonensis]|uniref:hypothetical protein n=1 Tax=Lactobacillus rizhaonensis TaxID=3082863 RepID=UPI0030C69B27